MRTHKAQTALSFAIVTVLALTIPPRAMAQNSASPPSAAERQSFQEKMLAIPHGVGCFVARYADPHPHWEKVKCGKPPKTPNPMARGPKPKYVGAGLDYFSQPGGVVIGGQRRHLRQYQR